MGRAAWLRIVAIVVAVLALLSAPSATSSASAADETRRLVLVAPAKGTIDLGLAPFVDRVVDEAERDGAAAVVLDIDTFGGRLDAAVAIRDRLLASRVRTVAFVHPRAISAGALVSLSAETIAMSGGSTMGAATPVQLQPGGTAMPVDEKAVSFVRKEFRATAEQRGRPVELAEAMVDKDVDVPSLAPPGKLLTLTGDQAIALGVADVRADDLPRLLHSVGLEDAAVRLRTPNWAERVVSALTASIVSSILMTLGMIGLMVELRTPGFGVPGIVGIICLALFFGAHWIVRLAGFEELMLVGVGLALLAVEVFVTPGFGLPGVLGALALVAGLGLSLVGAGATTGAVVASLGRVAISLILAFAFGAALFALLPRFPFARGIVLSSAGPMPSAATRPEASRSWNGVTGMAATPLRPAGTAWLDGERVDVVTDGEFVAAGGTVLVIKHEGNRVVVRAKDAISHERKGK
jgi:membrane-bound serine protease (ClpP class)